MSENENKSENNSASASTDGDKKSDDVDTVLNAALQDFTIKGDGAGASSEVNADMMPPFMSQEAAQQAAADFQTMLKQLAKVQEEAMKQPSSQSDADQPADNPEPTTNNQEDLAAQFLKDLQEMQEKAGKVAGSANPDDFFSSMQDFQEAGFQNDFMPFMHGMMTSLLSKEMMYPSLSEMVEKYPKWLDDNKSSITAQDFERYSGQLATMRELIDVYDNERDNDDDETKMKRFDAIMQLMQKMQMAGHPPPELVGDMPPGWDFDATSGLPQVSDPKAAAENGCALM